MEQGIIFKINVITFKCLNNLGPSYLRNYSFCTSQIEPSRSSSNKQELVTVPYNLKTYSYWSYSIHAPIL